MRIKQIFSFSGMKSSFLIGDSEPEPLLRTGLEMRKKFIIQKMHTSTYQTTLKLIFQPLYDTIWLFLDLVTMAILLGNGT